MKFTEALDYVMKKNQEIAKKRGEETTITPPSAKIMACMWNMLVYAQKRLDDIVYIDNNNNIISVPLDEPVTVKDIPEISQGSESEKPESSKKGNPGRKARNAETVIEENGTETKQPETTE